MKRKLVYLLIILTLLVVGPYFIRDKVLVVEEARGRVIYQQRVDSGFKFAIKYTHSVENTPVWDYFKVLDRNILLTSTKYMSYGAGLPFLKKNNYQVQDEKFIIKEINTQLEKIPLRVSDYAKHKLLIDQEVYKLYQLTAAQNLVMIKVEEKNLYQFLAWEVSKWRKKKN
ncbi:DUF1850 domain-containing protein [Halanaerobacter jeridensis]|uniref:DUF1850 domain-containing protein n=1 Tax=Halanaerobacter jeridensis TaxID=706427 RepID=A0A938XPG7_9FIRM|nr:DUF1850 domain-containing protein [Halanaerobacter jeridensis]MBM7556918.1 hypothetical protein [Halanaerobacter jeridensis]